MKKLVIIALLSIIVISCKKEDVKIDHSFNVGYILAMRTLTANDYEQRYYLFSDSDFDFSQNSKKLFFEYENIYLKNGEKSYPMYYSHLTSGNTAYSFHGIKDGNYCICGVVINKNANDSLYICEKITVDKSIDGTLYLVGSIGKNIWK